MSIENLKLIQLSLLLLEDEIKSVMNTFYEQLFEKNKETQALFKNDPALMNTKFVNMLATFSKSKHLEEMLPAIQELGVRHVKCGVKTEQYEDVKAVLLSVLTKFLGEEFSEEMSTAWNEVYDEIADPMIKASEGIQIEEIASVEDTQNDVPLVIDSDLLDALGGRDALERIHQKFYEILFKDAWLGKFFHGKNLSTLVRKQTDFMVSCLGGSNVYKGETPAIAHMHMFLTDEMMDLRQQMLRQVMEEEGIPDDLINRWIKVDDTFRSSLVRSSPDECIMRCVGQGALISEKPEGYPWPIANTDNKITK